MKGSDLLSDSGLHTGPVVEKFWPGAGSGPAQAGPGQGVGPREASVGPREAKK